MPSFRHEDIRDKLEADAEWVLIFGSGPERSTFLPEDLRTFGLSGEDAVLQYAQDGDRKFTSFIWFRAAQPDVNNQRKAVREYFEIWIYADVNVDGWYDRLHQARHVARRILHLSRLQGDDSHPGAATQWLGSGPEARSEELSASEVALERYSVMYEPG